MHYLLKSIALAGCLLAVALLPACGSGSATSGAVVTPNPDPPPPPADPYAIKVQVTADKIVMSNGLIERVWTRAPFVTERITDLRNHRVWSESTPDFSLTAAGIEFKSDALEVSGDPVVTTTPKGSVRVALTLTPAMAALFPPGFSFTRTIEIYPHVAGLRQETSVTSTLPLAISDYSLDESAPAGTLSAAIHSFRAGADWREPEWTGPALVVGDPNPGDWRHDESGAVVSGTAQWMSLTDEHGARLFYVMERNDYNSSTMSYDGSRARARVDLSRDVIYLGPFEEQVHVGNPGSGPGRVRALLPGMPVQFEAVFTGVALDADDEPWQHYKYLADFRAPPYRREITFNSNGVDGNRISTGAKDDMDFAEVQKQAAAGAAIGIETFVLDDGWQARSGDWCPDSVSDDPACADPRRGSDPKFEPRFPDGEFTAVRGVLQPLGMNLGLWMSPLHFNPQAIAFQNHPEWACLPISAALIVDNQAQPDSGSNEAGIAQWNPEAVSTGGVKFIDYLESRIRTAIDVWGVRYFKFDFTAWLDCVGTGTTDLYGYRESFMRMLDRVHADHPDVTVQMDETNDYRLFPFEALARGPTWYQNGSPSAAEALHANHVLAPYIPLYALGRNALRSGDLTNFSADYQMAVALLSHITFFNDMTQIPAAAVPVVKKWMDYYKAHRIDLAAFAYPLLADDPIHGDKWSAFQTWNPDTGNGALLVYRQDADETTQNIKLRNVPDGNYQLFEAPDETQTFDYSAAQLRAGIDIAIPNKRQARVLRIARKAAA